MNLSSIASALGAGYQGYDVDQREAAQRALLQRQQDTNDEDRLARLRMAGYVPASPANPNLDRALTAATGQANIPLQTGMTGGTTPAPKPLDAALQAASGPPTPPLTITTRQGPQNLQFDYDSSPQGQQERRARAKEVEDQARQTALAKQHADTAEQLRVAAQTRALGSIQKYYPSDPSATGQFDPNANDYVKSFADLEAQDRSTKSQIAVAKAAAAAQDASTKRAADLDQGKLREGTDPVTHQPAWLKYDPATNSMVVVPGAGPKVAAGAGGGSAPMASKEGQFGEMLKKAPDLFKASEALDVGVGQSAARDVAENGIGAFGMHIPGTKGIGSLMLNNTPEYAVYQAALTPFVLANAHALSGARINKDQSDMIRQSIERQPGDLGNPTVVAQRDKNVIDQMNSIAGSLPVEAVKRQEAQLDPAVLKSLIDRGYKSVSAANPGVGGGGGRNQGAGTNTATPNAAKQAQRAARWNQLVTGGMDKAQATAQVTREIP